MSETRQPLTRERLLREYIERPITKKEYALECGWSEAAIAKAVRLCGLSGMKAAQRRFATHVMDRITEEELRKRYWDEWQPTRAIAKEFGVSQDAVLRRMKQLGVPLRSSHNHHPSIFGKVFGKLVVMNDEPRRTKRGLSYHCQCECGNTKWIVREKLGAMSNTSCGCGEAENRRKLGQRYEYPSHPVSASYMSILRNRCKRACREFTVTQDELYQLYQAQGGRCALSGVLIQLPPDNKNKRLKDVVYASLDRIDSDLGYISGNVQWVTVQINKMKMDMRQDDFVAVCRLVAEQSV